jgi:hypothetical protein
MRSPGTWVFEIWYGQARVIKKTFTVFVPEDAEDGGKVETE